MKQLLFSTSPPAAWLLSALIIPALPAFAEDPASGSKPGLTLKPIMAVPADVVLNTDFSKSAPLAKGMWLRRQGTRWAIEDGVLRGRPSSAEFQAARSHHQGLEPRLSVPLTPRQFVARFSLRFQQGAENAIVPFVEFGHHVCRLKFSQQGLSLLADSETVRLAEAKDFRYRPGRWYHCLAELKNDEFVVQFLNGPTLYARHTCFAEPVSSGGRGLGVAGPRNGLVEIDNLTLWKIRGQAHPDWPKRRASMPVFQPVRTGKTKKPRPAAGK